MLVAVTVMRAYDEPRREWRDLIDARWYAFLDACGLEPLLLPNCPSTSKRLLENLNPRGLLLTGGGTCSSISGRVDDRDNTEDIALQWAERLAKPVIGVCRGMQVVLTRAGVPIEKIDGHVRTDHRLEIAGLQRHVNSYHEYGFRSLACGYDLLGRAKDGVIEAAASGRTKTTVMMWHPERQCPFSPEDIAMFKRQFGA